MADKFAILERYNFWKGTVPELGLRRNEYLNKIADFIGNKLVKVLVGQRRVGKSYILRQIIFSLIGQGVSPKNIFYLNKEFADFDFITAYGHLDDLIKRYKQTLMPEGKIYLFIDEIQNIEGWEHLINSYSQDFTQNCEIFISGSNTQLLSGELATLLSGRYVQFQILPFSYREYIEIEQLDNSKTSYQNYLKSGGLPELFHLPNDETKRHYVTSIKDTILLRDIIQRYRIKDARLLEDIFIFLVNNASNLISINKIVNYFKSKNRKTNYETVANYIGYLKNTFLVHQVDRFNIKGKDIVSGNCKYYINDLAFKNYLYPGFEYGLGSKLENLIYLQLLNSGYTIYTGVMRDKEIDFVASKNNRDIYLQVAYLLIDKKTIEREFGELERIPDNYEKFVISLDDLSLQNYKGIKHVLAWQLNDIL
mgnify:FL=1